MPIVKPPGAQPAHAGFIADFITSDQVYAEVSEGIIMYDEPGPAKTVPTITPTELQAAITDAIRDMDGDAALEAAIRLGLQRPQHSSAQRVVGRGLDLQAVIRLARGGAHLAAGSTHSGTPLEDVADAAQRALSNPDAVAAWVCAPITPDTTGA